MSDVLDSEERPRPRLRRPLVLVGAAALVVTAGVGVAAAASNTPAAGPLAAPAPAVDTTATPTPAPKPTEPGERRKHRWPGKHHVGAPFGALHGEFTVPKAGGGYQTIATQRGAVTAVSSTRITVKSEDGYSRTYAVTASTIVRAERDGIAAVEVGDQVAVSATVSGETATATHLVDLTHLRNAPGGKRWFR